MKHGSKLDLVFFSNIMKQCFNIANVHKSPDNYPISAAVVIDSKIISLVPNMNIDSIDPTSHPEILAIREACRTVNSRYLEKAILFSTVEPCPMCVSAAIWARMDGIVYSLSQETIAKTANKQGKRSWRQIIIPSEYIAKNGDPVLWVVGGIEEELCLQLIK